MEKQPRRMARSSNAGSRVGVVGAAAAGREDDGDRVVVDAGGGVGAGAGVAEALAFSVDGVGVTAVFVSVSSVIWFTCFGA